MRVQGRMQGVGVKDPSYNWGSFGKLPLKRGMNLGITEGQRLREIKEQPDPEGPHPVDTGKIQIYKDPEEAGQEAWCVCGGWDIVSRGVDEGLRPWETGKPEV